MSDTIAAEGKCLCGAVTIKAQEVPKSAGACHCSMCRGWGGGPFMTTSAGTKVTLEGETNVGVFDSSKWAERGFCKACGTHLFYRLKQTQQHMIPLGVLKVPEDYFVFDHQVFVDERPNYYCFSNETKDMTGPEIFAMYT